ncbi:hypothetical protein EJ08DRAFT_552309, partial [Tothia fuscella]
PAGGHFAPWASGPRVCPGRKFARVEFVATISTLFRGARIEAEGVGKETKEATRRRV